MQDKGKAKGEGTRMFSGATDVHYIGPTDREWAHILASALAWSVGRFEGMDVDPGYAGQVLDQWRHPVRLVKGTDPKP